MDSGNDSRTLLQRDGTADANRVEERTPLYGDKDHIDREDHEVVDEREYKFHTLQLLEGPTDNPIRLITLCSFERKTWSATFYVGGPGWNILSKIWEGCPPDPSSEMISTLDALIILVKQGHAKELGATLDWCKGLTLS